MHEYQSGLDRAFDWIGRGGWAGMLVAVVVGAAELLGLVDPRIGVVALLGVAVFLAIALGGCELADLEHPSRGHRAGRPPTPAPVDTSACHCMHHLNERGREASTTTDRAVPIDEPRPLYYGSARRQH